MGTYFHKHAENDPLCGFFRWGSKLFRITNSHVCIVNGHVSPDLLRKALRNVVQQFESLRDLWIEKGMCQIEDDIFKVTTTRQTVAFDSLCFRNELMDFVAKSEPNGCVDYPVKLHVIYAEDGNQTCVHLGISHDLADVKSGNILLAGLIKEYKLLLSSANRADQKESQDCLGKQVIFAHVPLTEIKPNWYAGGAAFRRRARAYLEIAKRMITRQRTLLVATSKYVAVHSKATYQNGRNDFFHQTLPEKFQQAVFEAAKRHRTTVNTLFSAALVRYISNHQTKANSPAVYTIAFSLRKFLGSAFDEVFRSFMIDCTFRIPPSADTPTLLRTIESEVDAIRQGRLEIELGRMENAISLFRPPVPKALVYWIMKRTQGTNILYSNPGIVEEDFTNFGPDHLPIRDIAVFGCLVPPYDLMFLTPTVAGRLQLTVVYRSKLFRDIQQQFVTPFLRELEQVTR